MDKTACSCRENNQWRDSGIACPLPEDHVGKEQWALGNPYEYWSRHMELFTIIIYETMLIINPTITIMRKIFF